MLVFGDLKLGLGRDVATVQQTYSPVVLLDAACLLLLLRGAEQLLGL